MGTHKIKKMEALFLSFRRRGGKAFRKTLGDFTYKQKINKFEHKKPGQIPLNIKMKYYKKGHEGQEAIKSMERKSHYPFGKNTRHGNFLFDKSKVPNFNVPD